jgi:uncharacterized protein (DUF302 family)
MSPITTGIPSPPGFSRSRATIAGDASMPSTATPRAARGSATRPVPMASSSTRPPPASSTRNSTAGAGSSGEPRSYTSAHRSPKNSGSSKLATASLKQVRARVESAMAHGTTARSVRPVIVTRSGSGYDETAAALVAAIERRGLTVFARIDHAAAAREAGLELEGEEVVVFGSPQAGTPLMQADRGIGIELPLRMLVWRAGNDVQLGYRDPRELASRYDVAGHEATLEQMAALLAGLAAEAAG